VRAGFHETANFLIGSLQKVVVPDAHRVEVAGDVNAHHLIGFTAQYVDGVLGSYRHAHDDAFGILFAICGLALSGYMSWVIALAVLVTYFLLSIDVYLATYTIGTFRLSFYKFSPTELRIVLAVGNIRAMLHPTARVLGDQHLFFDIGAVIAIAMMAIIVIVSVIRNTIVLYRAEKV